MIAMSRLGQRQALAPNADLHVSPLQLGSGNHGSNWNSEVGDTDKETTFKLLDTFYDAGGNFIDTCQGGLFEEYVGEWAEQRDNRDQLIIAAKCSSNLSIRSIVPSLEENLKKLRTSYIDIFYVDFQEWCGPVEEVMNGLHDLVASRRVFYLGLSNTPAWICSKANMYACIHGKTPFVIYQGSWNVLDHTLENDIVPMTRAEGMAIAFRHVAPTGATGDTKGISLSLERVSKELGIEHVLTVAVAYILHKISHVFPIFGGTNVEQLLATIQGLEISLSSKHISSLESAAAYKLAHVSGADITDTAVLNSIMPEPVDPTGIASAWLKDFVETTASGNAHSFATKLFKPDGWFRDVLVFTWDNRTLHGHGPIIHYLEEKLPIANITNIVMDEAPGLRPSHFNLPFGQGIEFSFRFETPIAFARGLCRLIRTNPSEMKALSVFVMMEDLKGHEESGAEIGLYGGHTITWNEVLEERRFKAESDPQVVIIGGGQSGLHVAARFKQMNIPALIVETNHRIGDNWRKRYPSLTLHTPKPYCATLYQPYPSNFPIFIPRDKIADWLEHYAMAQDLIVWTKSQVLPKATYDTREKRWMMQVDRDGTIVELRPKHIVIATGVHGPPYIPAIPHSETFLGKIRHTSEYLGGQEFAGLRVVVVGAGNSSADICQDLVFRGAASVTMVQRSKTFVISSSAIAQFFAQGYPEDCSVEISDFKRAATPLGIARVMGRVGIEQARVTDKDMLEGLQKAGFQHDYGEDNPGPAILYLARGGGYWLDVGCAELIASGKVAVRQGVEPVSFTDTGLVFDDGTELEVDAVIFATGYTDWRDRMKDIFDPAVLEYTKDMWGLDEEDEMCGVYRPTGYPALWYAAGDFADSRFRSKQLALHIKAEELNLTGYDHST